MRIELKFSDGVAVVRLSGKFLAGGDGPFLRQKVKDLIEAGTRRLVIDFADVPYIDSTGLGFLAGSHITAKQAGVGLVLSSLNPHVRKVLDDVQLSQFFVIAQDERAAIAMLQESGVGSGSSGPTPTEGSRGRKHSSGADA
jgi:anti-anti-sigma factor